MSAPTMPEEGFLRRWARLKAHPVEAPAATDADAPVPTDADAPAPPAPPAAVDAPRIEADDPRQSPAPTLDDVAQLTRESDYSAFVAQGVDKTVQRMALKKLFADPHFNVMDGLDIYIDDYNNVAPLTAGMLASLKHAPGVLSKLFGEEEQDQEDQQNQQNQEDETEQGDAAAPALAHVAHDPDGATPPPQQQGTP